MALDFEGPGTLKIGEIEEVRRMLVGNFGFDLAALGCYLARLEHVNKGAWVECYNKSTGSWEWFRWDR